MFGGGKSSRVRISGEFTMRNTFKASLTAIAVAALAMAGQSAHASLIHQYTFNDGTANDSVGTANGTLVGTATISNGQLVLTGNAGTNNNADYVSLPASNIDISSYTAVSFVTWFTAPATPAVNSQLFALGGTISGGGNNGRGYGYIIANPTTGGTANYRTAISAGPSTEPGYTYGETSINGGLTSTIVGNGQHELVVTDDNSTLSIYLDGVLKNSTTVPSKNLLSGLNDSLAYIGKSVYSGDPLFAGSINEFDIYNNALSATDVSNTFATGPVPVPEPASLGLTVFGAMGLLLLKRRNKSAA
jgi:hypothetical protein